MGKRLLGTRRFEVADQQRFAALSGDFNPLHVDATLARRAMFGEPVVHGMHLVAWALELYLADLYRRGATAFTLRRLSGSFSKPVFLRELIRFSVAAERGDTVRLQIGGREATFCETTLHGDATPARLPADAERPGTYSRLPAVRTLDDLRDLSGTLALYYEGGALREAFPRSCRALGRLAVARILGVSRLVGMECPGLHSLFSSFDLEVSPEAETTALAFTVERVDPRISAVRVRVRGGLDGTVSSFVRPPAAEQASMGEIARTVTPQEFAGQRALIVGGSRGLGESMAKIIACGGGHPIITYRHGEEDAKRVLHEIRGWGGTGDMIRLDVAKPGRSLTTLARTGWTPTDMYYFATPRIFVRKTRLFEERLFRRFLAVYVDGFLRTARACRRLGQDPLRIFYPSSVAVTEGVRELTEYAAAKAAGEVLCRHLEQFGVDTRVLVERLPRIRTDQTASLLKIPAADAFDIARDIARRMKTLAR